MTRRSPFDYLVIMPFAEGPEAGMWRSRFETIIKAAVDGYEAGRQRKRRHTCERMDTRVQPGSITDALARRLLTADIVIADLSGANANVFYELGVRHAARAGTILIAEQNSERPFDVSTELIIPYDEHAPAEAISNIQRAIASCHDDPGHPDSAALRAKLALEEPAVYARWRHKNRYLAPINGLWIERVDRGTRGGRDIHFSVFEFRYRRGVLHPFEMGGYSFDATGRLHSKWVTKYVRVKNADEREIEVEYVYSARRKGQDRAGYGQCTFMADRRCPFATGGGFYLAGEENPPRRRDYELYRVTPALLHRLRLNRVTLNEKSLPRVVRRLAEVLGTRPIHRLSKYPAAPARRSRLPRRRESGA